MNWQTSRFAIALDRPLVMGIVNATPDSFFRMEGVTHSARALRIAEQLIRDGADILDIGGESTPRQSSSGFGRRAGAGIACGARCGIDGSPVSVDTYKPEVMQAVP